MTPWVGCIALWIALAGPSLLRATETNAAPPDPQVAVDPAKADAESALRAYVKMQEQLHADRVALVEARREMSSSSKASFDALAARLDSLEQALQSERHQEWQSVQSSNRTLLLLGIGFGVTVLIALVGAAFFQVRVMNRLVQIAANPPGAGLMPQALTALANSPPSPSLLPVASSSPRLLGSLEHLEKRVRELEAGSPGTGVGEPASKISGPSFSAGAEPGSPLLGKGQALLNLGQADEALACFDEILQADPKSAEAHLRRGMALERLKRWDEAVACFDRAITLDRTMTRAYLCKGAVFNLQERYNDALECYELALRVQSETSKRR